MAAWREEEGRGGETVRGRPPLSAGSAAYTSALGLELQGPARWEHRECRIGFKGGVVAGWLARRCCGLVNSQLPLVIDRLLVLNFVARSAY